MNSDTNFSALLNEQKAFFEGGVLRDAAYRKMQLELLLQAIRNRESEIIDALKKDLNKAPFESYAAEIGLVYEELRYHIKHVKKWARGERVSTNQLINFWSTSRIVPQAYGQVLIIAPWNYPFQLVMMPLIGALSAGNTVVIKPSEFTPHVAEVLQQLISDTFPAHYVTVVNGDADVSKSLLELKWDKLFFTGSPRVGRIIAEAAAKNLTPVTLELGGKSPTIVSAKAKIDLAAKRIIWGKLINAGQTCIAPDYVFVQNRVKEEFVRRLVHWIEEFYGTDLLNNDDYPSIVNKHHAERLAGYISDATVLYGGKFDVEKRFVAPTIIDAGNVDKPVMTDEIFGPILPILGFDHLQETIDFISSRPKPLALYFFSESKREQNEILSKTSSGSMAINETLMQVANNQLPFGGVGNSGNGSYHGKRSFIDFSHERSVLKKITWFDMPLRYPPYGKKLKWVKMFLK